MPVLQPRAPTRPRPASLTAGLALVVALVVTAITAVPAAGASADDAADICLEVAPGALEDAAWEAMGELVVAALAARPALFPRAAVRQDGSRLDIVSGHDGPAGVAEGQCLEPEHEWSARYGRGFLQAGAERLLAEAPTTPGIESSVTIEWHPAEDRLRTLLEFSGPFGIPNGRCWIDDVLAVDAARGMVVASAERGLATSPFAESACSRFYDHLPEGGAGEQAVTLLPREVPGHDGSSVRLVAEVVSVREDAIVVSGRLERAD